MMRLPSLPRFQVAPRYVLLAVTAGLSLAFAAGCLYSPSGVNTSTTLYPIPDENSVVTVSHTLPTGKTAPSKVTFQVSGQDAEATGLPDPKEIEDTGPEYVATFATDKLESGLYFVDIFYDEEEAPAAKQAFVVPEEATATADEAATEEE